MRNIVAVASLMIAAAEDIDPNIYAKMFTNKLPLFNHMARAVVEMIPSEGKVLDLGSSPGENSHVVWTDVLPKMKDMAKSRIRAAGLNTVDFTVTSVDDLSGWRDGGFDSITMSFVLMFAADKAKLLREIARLLKPGRFAYTVVWKKFARDAVGEVALKVPASFTVNPLEFKPDNAMEDLTTAAGLEIVDEKELGLEFDVSHSRDVADGAFILAGGMLQQFDCEGDVSASKQFYAAINKTVQENGWGSGGEVNIPDNLPQLLILQKPLRKDEL